MLTPEPYYRNQGCKEMAARIANISAEETLNIKIRAEQILDEMRTEAFREQLSECLKLKKPFILYDDESRLRTGNYYVIIPETMKMICYMDGRIKSQTVSTTLNAFANNLSIAVAAYNKIWVPQKQVGL